MTKKLTNAFGKTFLTIELDPHNRWIHIIWENYLSEANVKAGSLVLIETLQASGFSCVLNDMRLVLGPISSSEWAAREWAPQAARAGLKHMAMVNAPDAMASPDISNFQSQQSYFQTSIFANIDDGKEWLRQHCS